MHVVNACEEDITITEGPPTRADHSGGADTIPGRQFHPVGVVGGLGGSLSPTEQGRGTVWDEIRAPPVLSTVRNEGGVF